MIILFCYIYIYLNEWWCESQSLNTDKIQNLIYNDDYVVDDDDDEMRWDEFVCVCMYISSSLL